MKRQVRVAVCARLGIGVAVGAILIGSVPQVYGGMPPSQRCGDGVIQSPETCEPPGSTLPNGSVCRKDCTFCGDKVVNTNDGEQCDPPNKDSCSATCTTCSGSLCANPALGHGGDCSVLELSNGSVSVNGPAGGVLGDVCIGPNGKLDMSGSQFVNGSVRLAQGATFQHSGSTTVGTVLTGQDLSAQINDALSAASTAAGLGCTQTFASLKASGTITGNGGANVICVGDVVLQAGQTLTLKGGSNDTFVLNVTGKFSINGARIVASGVRPKDVLYNIIGTGEQVAFTGGGGGSGCCNASADGTVLAPKRNIALSPGLVNGDVVGGLQISIVSGASVRCPPSPCAGPGSGTCASPIVVPAAGGDFTGVTSGTSAQSSSTCGVVMGSDADAASANAPEQVFQWTPSTSGVATIKTCGTSTSFDTVVYMRSGACDTGTEVACNDDTASCGTADACTASRDHHGSMITPTVTAGKTYFIFVDGFAGSCGGSSGNFGLTIIAP